MAMAALDQLNLMMRINHTPVPTLMRAACKIPLLVLPLALVSLNTALMLLQKTPPSPLVPAHLCRVADPVRQHKVWVDNSKTACHTHKTINRPLVDILNTAVLATRTLNILAMAGMVAIMHLLVMAQLTEDEAGQVSMAVVSTRKVDAVPELSCKTQSGGLLHVVRAPSTMV